MKDGRRVGAVLAAAGLTRKALAAWAGTDHVPRLFARDALPRELATPAAATLAVFVAGATAPRAALRLVDDAALAALEADELVERIAGDVRARVAILPVGDGALLVADRSDAPDREDLVEWPDDSSYHLAKAIPSAQVGRWLDLGCGSAFAPLVRPRLAREVGGVDVVERAARYARAGAALSGTPLEVAVGDAGAAHPWRGTCDLVTCNAPIPAVEPVGTSARWRTTEPALFARLWDAARALLAPGGTFVLHAKVPFGTPPAVGERVTIAYNRAFAITWWRPDGAPRHLAREIELSPAHPHVEARDREDVIASSDAG